MSLKYEPSSEAVVKVLMDKKGPTAKSYIYRCATLSPPRFYATF